MLSSRRKHLVGQVTPVNPASSVRAPAHSPSLRLIDAAGRIHMIGDGTPPRVSVRLRSRRIGYTLALNPGLSVGEACMDGLMVIEEGTIEVLDCASFAWRTDKRFQRYQGGHKPRQIWPTELINEARLVIA